MNTNDLLLRWSNMTIDQIEAEIRAGKDQESAVQLLGPETVAEIRAVSFAPPDLGSEEAVVLLPGIMGSDLSSIRGVTMQVWINPLVFLDGNARYLGLNEDGTQDAFPEVEMVPIGIARLHYLRMSIALNKAADLFEFPYDWRRPVSYNADVLHRSLERWAGGSQRKFHLVAHSMGGLVARAYMARHPQAAAQRVKQLIMMGTPNFGATNAIESLFSGNSLMDIVNKLNSANEMKQVVRGFPGVYNLLPAPPEFFPGGNTYPADWDLYHAPTWRTVGIQQRFLDDTFALQKSLAQSDPQLPQTMIAGCNIETLIRIKADFSDEAVPRLVAEKVKEGADSGDATVPLWSALLPGASTFYIQEKHGTLPANRQVIQAVLALIREQRCALPAALPAPRRFAGVAFDVQQGSSPEELQARIRSGTADQDDLDQLYFAL